MIGTLEYCDGQVFYESDVTYFWKKKKFNTFFFVSDVVDGFTRKPATRVSLIGHQYQPSIQIENSSSQNFLSTTEILDKDFEAKANRTSFYLFQDEMGNDISSGWVCFDFRSTNIVQLSMLSKVV